jgi:alkyl hydroperoxide reductase subunit AhpF
VLREVLPPRHRLSRLATPVTRGPARAAPAAIYAARARMRTLVIVFVGMVPRTELLEGTVPLADGGYVETTDAMETPVPGLYAAGDIRVKRFRQITTAVADGTIAALAAQRYVKEQRT